MSNTKNPLIGKIVYCESCGAIGPHQEMTPYEYGRFFKSRSIYQHKGCGGDLQVAFHYVPYKRDDGSTGRMVASIKAPEWEAMTPAERKQVAIDNQAICDNSARMDKLRASMPQPSYEENKASMKEYRDFTKYYNDNLTCPMCGSHVVKKLTTAERAVSVAAWGLASGKIGKQYECKKCGHKW